MRGWQPGIHNHNWLSSRWKGWKSDRASATTVGAFAAKTHLGGLLARVEAGESITITRHGRPVARLVPVAHGRRRVGIHPGADQARNCRGPDVRAFILDASMAVAWFFPSAPHDATALEKRALLDEFVALIPTIWRARRSSTSSHGSRCRDRSARPRQWKYSTKWCCLRLALSMIRRPVSSSHCRPSFG